MSAGAVSTEIAADPYSDWELWQQGVMQITGVVTSLSSSSAAKVGSVIGQLIALKRAIHAIVEGSTAPSTCADCGGMCCRCGKYHFSAIDLVAYLATKKELFVPAFDGDGCLFLDQDHCLMPPGYRPFNCITFVCELLEGQLSSEDRAAFYAMERDLRRLYLQGQQCFPDRRMQRSVMGFTQCYK